MTFDLTGSRWAEKHPQRARNFMQGFGVLSVMDAIVCPRCSQTIKAKGVPLMARDTQRYTRHVGSRSCRAASKRKPASESSTGVGLSSDEFGPIAPRTAPSPLSAPERGDAPFCACGCGSRVEVNHANPAKWSRYRKGHNRWMRIARRDIPESHKGMRVLEIQARQAEAPLMLIEQVVKTPRGEYRVRIEADERDAVRLQKLVSDYLKKIRMGKS